jgi:hypothetical protein
MNKSQRTAQIKREITPVKSQLIRLLGQMEREGLASEATQFGNIIARLEAFQNNGR